MDVQTPHHSVLADALTAIRDRNTQRAEFGAAVDRAAFFLLAHATRDLPTTATKVDSPVAPAAGQVLDPQPCLVPVLRAGLGLLEPARSLLPDAEVVFVGLKRDETTAAPHWYLDALPDTLAGRTAIVLEPMIATGGTLSEVIARLHQLEANAIIVVSLLCAPEGLQVLADANPRAPLTVVTACVDTGLTSEFFITPGLGDAGDRLFGPLHHH